MNPLRIFQHAAATLKLFKTIPHKSEGFIGTPLKVELFLVKLQLEISLYTSFPHDNINHSLSHKSRWDAIVLIPKRR